MKASSSKLKSKGIQTVLIVSDVEKALWLQTYFVIVRVIINSHTKGVYIVEFVQGFKIEILYGKILIEIFMFTPYRVVCGQHVILIIFHYHLSFSVILLGQGTVQSSEETWLQ